MDSSLAGGFFWFLCLSLFFLGFGLLSLFARDLMWDLTEWGNSWRGVTSERTENWESGQIISGVVMILIGGGLLCWGASAISTRNQQAAEDEARDLGSTATANSELADLQQVFGSVLSRLQADDSPGVHRASRQEVGVQTGGVFYGRCASGDFYAFILNYPYTTVDYLETSYAYVPASDQSPKTCRPDGLTLGFLYDPGALGSGWYRVSVYSEPREIITPTPRPPTATPTALPTANATEVQMTVEAAIQQQVATAMADSQLSVTQTIAAGVQATLTAAAHLTATPTP